MTKRWYVGHAGRTAEAFTADQTPTVESHPQYAAVVGPFQTARGARWAASPAARNNPHYQTVADAERIARELAESMAEVNVAITGRLDPESAGVAFGELRAVAARYGLTLAGGYGRK